MRARHRVFAGFFLYAFGLGGFFPRLGELQRSLGVAEGGLGLGLIGAASGTLIALTFAGPLMGRFGHRRLLLGLLPAIPLFYALAAYARGALPLFLILLPAGLCIGIVEMIVNLEADRVEHQEGGRIMNRSHAFWSFGFFAAGLLGTSAARAGISPQTQLWFTVLLVLGGTAALLGRFTSAPPRLGHEQNGETHTRMVRPTRHNWILFGLVLSAMVMEGAGIDWSSIYLREVFAATPFLSALGVTIGAAAQASARYVADGFVERHGPLRVARVLLVTLGVGVCLVVFAPAAAVALLGFALMGIGTSVMFPLAMSATAQLGDRSAEQNVAAFAQMAFVSFMLAPPLLGFIAQYLGLRMTFAVGLPLVLLSLLLSGALRPVARATAAEPGR